MNAWRRLLLFLVAGYLTMTRSFAYLGLPPAKIFIGELSLAAFVLVRPAATLGRWMTALWERSVLSEYAIALACFVSYGFFQVVRGLDAGHPTILTLEGFAFHYYPFFLFVGMWLGSADRGLLWRAVRIVAWSNGIYGLLYIVLLNRIPLGVPGTLDVPMFGQPAGSAVVLLAIISIEPKLSRNWHLLLLNTLVMLGLQVRAEFLAFLVGLMLWSLMTRRFDRVLGGLALVIVLLAIGLAVDFRMPAPGSRGGQISTRDVIGRVIAPFDPEAAAQYTQNATSEAGTVDWRFAWWQRIWDEVHQSVDTALLGEGYGYPLADLIGYHERDLRTPHSVFFYALGYGGWVGVIIFLLLQAALGRTLWQAWRISGLPFGPVLWAAFLTGALFGNAFETPFGAIPFYLLVGLSAAPLYQKSGQLHAYPAGAYLLQTAGR